VCAEIFNAVSGMALTLPSVRLALVVVAALVCSAAAFAGGWFLGRQDDYSGECVPSQAGGRFYLCSSEGAVQSLEQEEELVCTRLPFADADQRIPNPDQSYAKGRGIYSCLRQD
jgi:hypothetical protein